MDLMTEAFGSNAPDDDAGNDDEDDDDDDFDAGGDGPSLGGGLDDPDNGSGGDTSLMRALSDALGPLATETSEPEAPEEIPAISLWNDETLAAAGTEEVSGTPVTSSDEVPADTLGIPMTSSDEVPAAAPGTKEVSASSDDVPAGFPEISVASSDDAAASAPGTEEVSASSAEVAVGAPEIVLTPSGEVLSGTPGIQEVSEIPGPPSDQASRPDVPTHELAPNVSTEIPMEAPLSREADGKFQKAACLRSQLQLTQR